jgi:hypothetical protein
MRPCLKRQSPENFVAMDEIGRLDGGEGRSLDRAAQRQHEIGVEPAADDRRRLEEALRLAGQLIDPRRQDRLHALREGGVHRSRIEGHGGAVASDHPALEEEAHHLLGEQRVAFGLGGDEGAQRLGQWRGAQAPLGDAEGLARGQRIEGEQAHVRALRPGRGIGRPPCVQDEQAHRRIGADEAREQRFGGAVEPMDVFENQDGRGEPRPRLDDQPEKFAGP